MAIESQVANKKTEEFIIDERLSWSLCRVWNESLLAGRKERKLKSRDYIYASELGKDYLSRYLAMRAVKPSNPFDTRVLRKFEMGLMLECLVGNVLKKSGLIVEEQNRVRVELPNCLPVSGRYDFKVGQPKNWDEAENEIKRADLPPSLERVALELIIFLREKYPIIYGSGDKTLRGMKDILYEIKTVNSMVFWRHIDNLRYAYPHHRLQNYTYLWGTGIEEGRILYLSRDDMTIAETGVFLSDKTLEAEWKDDIKRMTDYHRNNIEPPKEEDLVKNPYTGKWEMNWKIRWSSYCSRITGMTREDWEKQASKEMKARNKQIKLEKEAREAGLTVPELLEKRKQEAKDKAKATRARNKAEKERKEKEGEEKSHVPST